MNSGGLILIIALIISATGAFIWLARKLIINKPSGKTGLPTKIDQAANVDVEHIFSDEFREELRNRGRLHFEKVIGENAMFLQQDLRETTAQLNDYMRTEISRTLQEEFKKYEQSITDAKQLALDSIDKTIATIEQQRAFLQQQLQSQYQAQKDDVIKHLEQDMAKIINHYVVQAIGNQIDISDQLNYILSEIERNKPAIIEDIRRGT